MTGTEEFGCDDHAYFVDGKEIKWTSFIEDIEKLQNGENNGDPIKTTSASGC